MGVARSYYMVKRATYIGNYQILIEFENDELRVLDCKLWLEEDLKSFSEIKQEEYFKKFFIDNGIITWPNEYDVAPEYVYENSKPAFISIKVA